MNKKILDKLLTASLASMLVWGTASAKEETQSDQDLINTSSQDTPSTSSLLKKQELFSNMVAAAEPVKELVDLCIFDQGIEGIENCTTGKKSSDFGSMGWDLSATPQSYATDYVESIEIQRGVITVKAKSGEPLYGETITIVPLFKGDSFMKWTILEDSIFEKSESSKNGESSKKGEPIISKIAQYISDNYQLFRKSNLSINIPAGEKLVDSRDKKIIDNSRIDKVAWESANLNYESKFNDPILTSSSLTIAIPKINAFEQDSNKRKYTLEGFKNFTILECNDTGLCTIKLELSAKSVVFDNLNLSDITVFIALDNVNIYSFMNNVCGVKNTALDLVSLDELALCLDDSEKFASSPMLIGEKFKITFGLETKIENKPLNLKSMLSIADSTPTFDLLDIIAHSNFELFFTADKKAIDSLPEDSGRNDLKPLLDEIDHNTGDSYKIEMICKAYDCKVNGVPLEEISSNLSKESSNEDSGDDSNED